ncbi:hypothetical protein EON76_05065 [bacterium]|nr:MAG: hypothetical protein EON76_05065 [bacterium]
MTDRLHHNLPIVTQTDILQMELDEFLQQIDDPHMALHWHKIREANPLYAQKILKAAFEESAHDPELQTHILKVAYLAYEMLRIAFENHSLRDIESDSTHPDE